MYVATEIVLGLDDIEGVVVWVMVSRVINETLIIVLQEGSS